MFKFVMKLFLINIFLLAALVSSGQTPLGVGLVSVDFQSNSILKFYTDTIDIAATKTIHFSPDIEWQIKLRSNHDERGPIWTISSRDEQGKWIETQEWLKAERSENSLVLRIKQQTKEWYEVIVNNQTGKTYWLKKSKLTKYLSWEDHLRRQRSISRLSASSQTIRRQPTEQSKKIKYSGPECFRVKSMNGEWIEIFLKNYLKEEDKHKIKTGWIKWRDGDNLLINFYCPSINGISQRVLIIE